VTRGGQRFILASAVIGIGALIVTALVFVNIPEHNEAILNVALGFVLGWGASAVNYYFGTSEGSAHKTDLMARHDERNDE
jgi:hypothetical protein